MDALLIFNNSTAKNLKIMVQVTEESMKNKVIKLLEKGKGGEAFDFLAKKAQVQLYIPGEMPFPKTPFLIVLDEQLLKNKLSEKLSREYIQKDPESCYT